MTDPVDPRAVVRTAEQLRANLAEVRARIDDAARAVDRDPASVRLLPVSKTVDDERLAWLADTGVTLVGENKVQEARRKEGRFADLGLGWAMIGHLQTNKVRQVVGSATEVHSVDRTRVAEALDRRLQAEGIGMDVFIQVNSSGEESKFGLAPDEVLPFARTLDRYPSLRVRGLMTLAIFSDDRERVAACFRRMQILQEQLRNDVDADAFAELSMGMSNDYDLAIAHGATTVRVGEAIFGPRHTGPDDYWPGVTDEARRGTDEPS